MGIAAIIQLHRLREVMALVEFTRFEAIAADINGEYEQDVERAPIAHEPTWFPAVENRGEGIFIQLHASAVDTWFARPPCSSASSPSAGATTNGRRSVPSNNDPLEGRWRLGAACHGCALVGESSCEMRNDYRDRALVVPVLGQEDSAFFGNAL